MQMYQRRSSTGPTSYHRRIDRIYQVRFSAYQPHLIYCIWSLSFNQAFRFNPELQGRLPIRVELQALTTEDYKRILIEPNASLTEQYKALMATEGISLDFADSGIEE